MESQLCMQADRLHLKHILQATAKKSRGSRTFEKFWYNQRLGNSGLGESEVVRSGFSYRIVVNRFPAHHLTIV